MYDVFDYRPVNAGKVYRNSKTKVFTDGTTNTIVSRSSIFKDHDINSEYMEFKDDREEVQEKIQREVYQSELDLVYSVLERCNMRSYEFYNLSAAEHDDNFLLKLSDIGMSLSEYDLINKHFNKKPMEEKERVLSEVRNDSMKRAKDQIFDYVLNNDFEYFFTGTINPEYFDSSDPKELLKPVQKWLKNMVQRYGLRYILIAERHKSGRIHFHGLFISDKPLNMIYSGTKLYKGYKKPISDEKAEIMGLCEGREVYNLKTWSFGFTTCIKLTGDRMNTAFYVTKYITKDCKKIFGKFFWHSRDLKKPLILIRDLDYDSIQSVEFNGYKYVFERGVSIETK